MLNGSTDFANVSQDTLKSVYNVFVTEYKQVELVKDVLKNPTQNGMNTSVDVFQDIHKLMGNV